MDCKRTVFIIIQLEAISKISFTVFSSILTLDKALFPARLAIASQSGGEGHTQRVSGQEKQRSIKSKDEEKTQKLFLRWLLLFFIIPGTLFSQEQTGIKDDDNNGYKKFYYPGGNLSSEGTLVNGKPEGYWKSYFENGKLKSEGNRLNFKLDSLWKFYNDSGYVTAEYFYKDGLKHGVQKNYYSNGIIQSEETDSMIYVMIAVIYIFPVLFLYRFSINLKISLRESKQENLSIAFLNLRSLFRFMGIATIVVISLYLVVFVTAIVFTAFTNG